MEGRVGLTLDLEQTFGVLLVNICLHMISDELISNRNVLEF